MSIIMESTRALSSLAALLLLQALACSCCTPSFNRRCDETASSWEDLFSEERLEAWLWSLMGSILVGLSGVLPLLVIPIEAGATLKSEGGSQRLKQLLSFAIGGLLGDVFLHLLPEAWAYTCSATIGGGQTLQQQKLLGLWVITGFLTFLVLEKMFPDEGSRTEWGEMVMLSEGSDKVMCSNRNGYRKAQMKEVNGKNKAGSAVNCKAGYSAPSMERKADQVKEIHCAGDCRAGYSSPPMERKAGRAKEIHAGCAGDCKAGYSSPPVERKAGRAKEIHAGCAGDCKAGYSSPPMERKAGRAKEIHAGCAGDCKAGYSAAPMEPKADRAKEILAGCAGDCQCVYTHTNGGLSQSLRQVTNKIKMSGYLNLLANTIDNFTHGMAVAGSFLVSKKVGVLTTLAILLHEIPHEVGDFAILLRAGFDRWSAAKMQVTTALGGILGACFAICLQSPKGAGETVAWILPFTSGGFLYIALVNVVPDLLEEKNIWNSVLQVCLLCSGVLVMMLLSLSVG